MGFGGGFGGGGRGGPRGGGGRGGGRGGFRGGRGGGQHFDAGPPEQVVGKTIFLLQLFQFFLLLKSNIYPELGKFMHPSEDDLVLKATVNGVPYFNAGVFLENKQQVGKVDDIFGPVNDYVS